MCNIWISLTEDTIKNHMLGLCDIRTVNEQNIIPYIATRTPRKEDSEDIKDSKDIKNLYFGTRKEEFIATALKYDSNNILYHYPNMKFGDSIIFDSKNTPHASVVSNINEQHIRQSLECRVMFLRNVDIPLTVDNKFYSLL